MHCATWLNISKAHPFCAAVTCIAPKSSSSSRLRLRLPGKKNGREKSKTTSPTVYIEMCMFLLCLLCGYLPHLSTVIKPSNLQSMQDAICDPSGREESLNPTMIWFLSVDDHWFLLCAFLPYSWLGNAVCYDDPFYTLHFIYTMHQQESFWIMPALWSVGRPLCFLSPSILLTLDDHHPCIK